MTKGIKNREQSARASNQKRDPATGRFTQAPDGVVLRRPSAGVPDVPPGFERVTPNRTRTGGVDVKSAHHAKQQSWLNTRAESEACQSIFLKLTKDEKQLDKTWNLPGGTRQFHIYG
jgi:hypothetical protein